jgi:hypothetical protein
VSETSYIVQALVIGGVISLLVRNEFLILRLQVIVWLIGVSAIAWRFGLVKQLFFYSNDQTSYLSIVQSFATSGIPWDVDVWLGSKTPYTVAALPLTLIGLHPTLALKTVSLVCLLALTRSVLDASRPRTQKDQVITLWLTACGSIGSFFSLLALRETMMMLFVYRFATSESLAVRGVSLIALYLLRPHLAAAVFAAEVVMVAWRWMRSKVSLGAAETPSLIAVGVILGTTLFSWGVGGSSNLRTPFSGGWGIPQAVRVASNFIGLQFITVPEDTVNYSLTLLLLLRIVLNETIVIPVAFTAVCLFFFHHLNDRARFTLLAFTTYSSVVIGTDFNSFRQNIPFMPLMGLVVLNVIRSRNADSLPEPVDSGLPHSPSVTPRGT